MARRRKRGPLAELKRGLRKSTPNRMLARFVSGGKHQTFGAILRAGMRANVPGPSAIPMRPVPRGSALPKTEAAAKRARSAAKKAAVSKQAVKQPVIKKTAVGKQVAKRGAKGRFDGSVVLPGADLSLYRRAVDGNAVVQPGEPGRRRL
jgi:hypothetical protein